MKAYIGVKKVNARPMTRGEYNEFRGWILPENENADDAGYLIEYVNSDVQPELVGKANGYVSWSPKTVFEDSYANVSQWGAGGAVFGRIDGDVLHVGYGDTLEDAILASNTTIAVENEAGQFDFSYALQLLLKGATVKRVDWPNNVVLKYLPENDGYFPAFKLYEDGKQGSTWSPTVGDLTEVCWELVEDKNKEN